MIEEVAGLPDTGIACACCGKPLNCLHSFSISTPVNERRIKPSDFCDLDCLFTWVGQTAAKATGRRIQ